MAEYIERAVALHEIERREALMVGDKRIFIGSMTPFIQGLPAADVAPVVHGYWEHKITSYGEIVSSCHNCKYPVSQFWELAKYCPSCGARMDGGNDG